jgi:small conductance mechanosensitive channel
MENLLNDSSQLITRYAIPWGVNIITSLLVFLIGRWFAGLMVAGARKMMLRAHLDEMLIGFLGNILYTSLLVVVAIAALGQMGIETTSLLALFATAGLAVGLALKDQLSNFAAGVMLIIFKPFKAGDFIEAGGVAGVVETIRVFNTVMRTADNRELTVPNAQIFSGTITNVSARKSRRIDLVVGIGYGANIQQAKELLLAIMQGETRILAEPAPVVMVAELGESSVDLAVRPWVAADDYWAVRSDLLQSIKNRFDEAGIAIPYPQRDVHLHGEASSN